ncbi:MAG: MaoC family dehydratase [Chloroflexi bacterium]|nr:MaoC family dehydratase [Chloroflexota bacterium]
MHIGQTFTTTRTFTQDDFNRFAALSGDDNPIHVDPEFSARTKFGRTVAHGMLLYGVICGAVSKHWPGAVQLEQDLRFPSPTYTDEEITIQLTVKEVQPDESLARIEATITRVSGQVTCEGAMLVRVAKAS